MVKRRSLFLFRFSFFGLTQEYRYNLFKQIHEIIFYGRGGYDYITVYNMPIWLRSITYKFISDSIDQESKSKQEAHNKALGKSGKTTLDWANPDKSKLK
jgi:hypothetical protein